jgi:hypothetical protein
LTKNLLNRFGITVATRFQVIVQIGDWFSIKIVRIVFFLFKVPLFSNFEVFSCIYFHIETIKWTSEHRLSQFEL